MVIQIRTNPDRFKNQDRTLSLKNSEKKNNTSDINFSGSPFKMSEGTKKKLYTGKFFNTFAKMTSNPVLLDATVVLGLACFLRPLTILNVPGAEKRDKQYASGHSIVSGFWGYATALAVFNPLNKAVENVIEKTRNSPDYLKKSFIKKDKKSQENFKFIASYGPKLILQPLVAAVTIALIPTAMKLLFNKDNKQKQQQSVAKDGNLKVSKAKDSAVKTSNDNSSVKFKGQVPVKTPVKSKNFITRFYEPIVEKLAQNKHIKNFADKMTTDSKSVFMQNILTTAQAMLGTFVYMGVTMKSPGIEEDRKKTLAANQFITWGISAIGTFTVSGLLVDKFKKIGANYKKYNSQEVEEKFLKNLITLEKKNKAIKKFADGSHGIAKRAPSMIVFAFIYRYLTPVLATPLANVFKKHSDKKAESKQPVKA